ncbi:MAG: glucosamine-6-phosphate deaminase [Candidatus Heimdallarchaeota archaeon]
MVEINIFQNKHDLGVAAAKKATKLLQEAIELKYKAYFIAATGTSQFEFLKQLCNHQEIDWGKIEMFHLDEYIGISSDHPASFRNYLTERIVRKVNLGRVNFIHGDVPDPILECRRLNDLISKINIDIAFVGIGENGHLAFNDPPADFIIKNPYIIVNLDEFCRKQQVGEGWFKSLEEVPKQAISMSINEILRAKTIICVCPEKRKAEAVKNCLSHDSTVSPEYPASILKTHPQVYCYLDEDSASLL